MSQIVLEMNAFIAEERNHFQGRDNNNFAMGFGQIIRYRQFLVVIVDRYRSCSKEFLALMERQKAAFSGAGGPMTQEQASLWQENVRISSLIQLEIESYYLFSKVLLDKIARFIEFYFGPERGLSLDSHDQLTKCFSEYATKKNLGETSQIEKCLTPLKSDIADFRDYQIAHEKSPRTVRGLLYSGSGVSMLSTKIYPKDQEPQVESKEILSLENDLHVYLREAMNLLRSNRERSKLARA